MVVVADASVAIRGDLGPFHRDLKGAEKATGGLGQKLRDIFSPRNILAGAGALGLGLGLHQLIRQVGDVVNEYDELKQSQQTVDDVFGASAKVIEDWADRAAGAAGMSEREVSMSASTMGTMLQNMGVDAATAADTVVTLQQRAADLATAFPGKSSADAMLAFSAALRGERDTVEKFGVTLTQAMIDARIETENLDTSTPDAERYATAIATLGLIMDQTAGSAGRFQEALDEGDSGALAASLGARIENANASLAANAEDLIRSVAQPVQDLSGFLDDVFNPEVNAKIEGLADLWGVTANEVKERVNQGMSETGLEYQDQLDHMVALTQGAGQELGNEGERAGKSLATGLTDAAPEVLAAAEVALMDPLVVALLGGKEEAARIAGEIPGGIGDALLDRQFDLTSAVDELVRFMEESIAPAQEMMELQGFLASAELVEGLGSNDPAIRQKSLEMKQAAESRILELGKSAFNYGFNFGAEYAAGIVNSLGLVHDAGRQLGGALGNQVKIESEPPDHSSPLYGHMKWGGNFVKDITDGIYGNLGTASSAMGALAGRLVPSLAGGAAGMQGGMGTGQTIQNFNLSVNGVPYEVRSPDEMIETLMALGVGNPEGRLP